MAVEIISETYNGLATLYANAGSRRTGLTKIRNAFYAGSGNSLKFTSYNDTLTRQSGNWGDHGFVAGDTITIRFTKYSPTANITYTRTINYIDGNVMYLSAPLPAPYNNIAFPTDGSVSGMAVQAIKSPQEIEFNFNLCPVGTASDDSVLDGELNRFRFSGVAGLAVNGSATMVQLGNKSGGAIISATITRRADETALGITYTKYDIEWVFLQWGLLQSGFVTPQYYLAGATLRPFTRIRSFALIGNPNGMMQVVSAVNQANVGWFNENYNGGVNAYPVQSMAIVDSLGNPIQKVDYSGISDFTAVITAPNQTNATSVYRIGLAFMPETESLYKNLPTSALNNLLVNAPDVNFLHSGTPSATVYTGFANDEGARFDLTNLQFSHTSGVLTVRGRIIPSAQCQAFFDNLSDGERKLAIWVQVSDHTKTGTANDEVNTLIYFDDCFDAPLVGVQYPHIIEEVLLDHAGGDIASTATANTTTQDDILYRAEIQLEKNVQYDGVRLAISARNTGTGEVFELENNQVSFVGVPFVGGMHQLNVNIPRNFNLPPSSDRNAIRLTLNPDYDTSTLYGVTVNYGFMNNWRYWLSQSGVNDDFFSLSQPNNGLNRNWQRFQTADWQLSIDMYVRKDGVEDFNHLMYINRPYEDDPTVTATITIEDSEGNEIQNFKDNEMHKVTCLFDWNQNFDDEWVEIDVENFENGGYWLASSIHAIGNVAGNPFSPVAGETMIKLTNLGQQLKAEVMVNTANISASDISMSFRVYSNPRISYGFLIPNQKDAELAWSLQKISPDSVWDGGAIDVIRDDNEIMTGLYLSNPSDLAALEAFSADGATVHISKFWDQSGTGKHGVQTDFDKMAIIAFDGEVFINTANGLPAWKTFDETIYDVAGGGFFTSTNLFQFMVVNRPMEGFRNIVAFGNDDNDKYTFQWKGSNGMLTSLGDDPIEVTTDPTVGSMLISLVHQANETNIYINSVLAYTEADVFQSNQMRQYNLADGTYGSVITQEIVVYRADKSAQLTNIHANIMGRYGL